MTDGGLGVEHFLGGGVEVGAEVRVGDVYEFLGPFADGLAEEPGDAELGDDGVGEGAGDGDDGSFVVVGYDS